VEWLKQELEALDGYYNVTLQTYFEVVQLNGTINAFSINGTAVPAGSSSLFEHSPTGAVSGNLVLVSNAACNFVRTKCENTTESRVYADAKTDGLP
jgi:hypothetical protein